LTEAVAVPQNSNTFAGSPAQQLPAGFQVPPAGGNPVRLPNQEAGWVQQPANQAQPAQQQPAAQVAAPAQLDAAGITALIQAALGSQAPAGTVQTPAPANAATPNAPAWLPANVNTFNPESITDPTIRSMATVLQSIGKDLDLTRVIGRALADGDVSLIDYAYLHEKGGANAQPATQAPTQQPEQPNAKREWAVKLKAAVNYGSLAVDEVWAMVPVELRADMDSFYKEQFIKSQAFDPVEQETIPAHVSEELPPSSLDDF